MSFFPRFFASLCKRQTWLCDTHSHNGRKYVKGNNFLHYGLKRTADQTTWYRKLYPMANCIKKHVLKFKNQKMSLFTLLMLHSAHKLMFTLEKKGAPTKQNFLLHGLNAHKGIHSFNDKDSGNKLYFLLLWCLLSPILYRWTPFFHGHAENSGHCSCSS
jgi:hypothetical protein